MFDSIISGAVALTPTIMAICTITSLIIGVLIAYVYKFDDIYSRQFVMTLVVLPTLVQMVIMMVNGNLGTSVAVLGTFGLVRFRSLPGSSKDICFIFFCDGSRFGNRNGVYWFCDSDCGNRVPHHSCFRQIFFYTNGSGKA